MSARRGREPEEAVPERILDAAGELFAVDGVLSVGMAEVAAAAGCSRATLYRWFEGRHALRVAFVHREARRLGARLAAAVDDRADPHERLAAAVLGAVEGVRSTPALAAWFTGGSAGVATDLASSSDVIEALAASFLGDAADPTAREHARWIVRMVLSLLTMPGASADDERHLVEAYVVPAVLGPRPPRARAGTAARHDPGHR